MNTARTQLEQRQIWFELDLQDDLMTKLPVLQARLKGLANAARNASCPESVELWEGMVSEIEFIADTTGKELHWRLRNHSIRENPVSLRLT